MKHCKNSDNNGIITYCNTVLISTWEVPKMGVPKNRSFIRENPKFKWMM